MSADIVLDEQDVRAMEGIRRPRQLSLLAGGNNPDSIDLRIAGALALTRELSKGEVVVVEVRDSALEVLATVEAQVNAVAFKDKLEGSIVLATERTHVAQVLRQGARDE